MAQSVITQIAILKLSPSKQGPEPGTAFASVGSLAALGVFVQAAPVWYQTFSPQESWAQASFSPSLKQPRSLQRLLQCGCQHGFRSWALEAALFLINTDTVTAFLGESEQPGTIRTLFVHGHHWGRPWPWGFITRWKQAADTEFPPQPCIPGAWSHPWSLAARPAGPVLAKSLGQPFLGRGPQPLVLRCWLVSCSKIHHWEVSKDLNEVASTF